jgi:SAM-dependent methyltransferase
MDTATTNERRQLHGMWASVAPAWGEHTEYVEIRGVTMTARLLELAAPRAGERVLELACGVGGLGIAAGLVGPAGEVVLSDVAAEMTAIAAARAADLGLGNVRTLTLDLDDLDEPDPGLRHRPVPRGPDVRFRPGPGGDRDPVGPAARGRVAVAVWGPRARNPWLAVVFDAVGPYWARPCRRPGFRGRSPWTTRFGWESC